MGMSDLNSRFKQRAIDRKEFMDRYEQFQQPKREYKFTSWDDLKYTTLGWMAIVGVVIGVPAMIIGVLWTIRGFLRAVIL